MPTIPSALADRYCLHAALAARGDVVTVAATDEILEREVWISLLLDADEERRTLFRQQAESLARRTVPGAPRVFDGSMRGPRPYVVSQPTPDGDPSMLLEVLTEDEAPTAEIPVITPPSVLAARTAPLPAAAPALPRGPTATTSGMRGFSRQGVAPRRVLLAAAGSVALVLAASATLWAGSEGDAPALADQMPVVQGVDATEEPEETVEAVESVEETEPPEPEVAATEAGESEPVGEEASAQPQPQPQPKPQEEPKAKERPGERRGQSQAGSTGPRGGGPERTGPPGRSN